MTIEIREVTAEDESAWQTLYRGYRAFYELAGDPASVERTWRWVRDGEHGLLGIVALIDGEPVGLANLRWFARPSTATIGLYLDDLFVAPAARERGVARALLARAAEIGRASGASVVRWITAADNVTARRVYDEVARATPWITYDMAPTAPLQE